LTVLDQPMGDVYGAHWSTDGRFDVPDAATPDEAVYLPGRNLLLAAKAGVWCGLRKVGTLAFGTLKANPFADGTPEFDRELAAVLQSALGAAIRVVRPFAGKTKDEVLRIGLARGLPIELTFSCLAPSADGLECGACNKCEERRRAFARVGLPDPIPGRAVG
jgi:7-cyano-7-deazaguanine synthase